MATPNRSALIARTLKVIRKHYKPVAQPKDRSVLEHLLFACLLEDSPQEAAEQVFQALKRDYFGWNEVRVSTIRELTDALKPLVNHCERCARLPQRAQEARTRREIWTLSSAHYGTCRRLRSAPREMN